MRGRGGRGGWSNSLRSPPSDYHQQLNNNDDDINLYLDNLRLASHPIQGRINNDNNINVRNQTVYSNPDTQRNNRIRRKRPNPDEGYNDPPNFNELVACVEDVVGSQNREAIKASLRKYNYQVNDVTIELTDASSSYNMNSGFQVSQPPNYGNISENYYERSMNQIPTRSQNNNYQNDRSYNYNNIPQRAVSQSSQQNNDSINNKNISDFDRNLNNERKERRYNRNNDRSNDRNNKNFGRNNRNRNNYKDNDDRNNNIFDTDSYKSENEEQLNDNRNSRNKNRGGEKRNPNNDRFKDVHKKEIERRRKNYQEREQRAVESQRDVFRELRCKQNQKLKNIDDKIFAEIDKFALIFDIIIHSNPSSPFARDAFLEVCNLFSMPSLVDSPKRDKVFSIYSLFFKDDNFIFSPIFRLIILDLIANDREIDKLKKIMTLLQALIRISKANVEKLRNELTLLENLKDTIGKGCQIIVDELLNAALTREDDNEILEATVAPIAEELFNKPEKINNSIERSWNTIDEYRSAMVGLTKENFYLPFRENLNKLLTGKLDHRDLFLYEKVSIAFRQNTNDFNSTFRDCNTFLTFKIRTPSTCKHHLPPPDWKRTERLGNRSLLILSTSPECRKIDAVCKSCACARSMNDKEARNHMNMLNNGIVPVVRLSGEIEPTKTYYMFEPSSSWSAVQPVIQRLLKMNATTFPQCLMNAVLQHNFKDNAEPEKYEIRTHILLKDPIEPELEVNYRKSSNDHLEFDTYTNAQKDQLLRVDHEQYKALRYALTHQLTLVNGAPGTGKTHFAREYLRMLYSINNPRPIVVITYTNHALDAFLESVVSFIDKKDFIRWGGPTRTENVIILSRKWNNKFFEHDVNDMRDKIVTMRAHLKNLYNIRQMVHTIEDNLRSNPQDFNNFKTLVSVISKFIPAAKILEEKYPHGFTDKEARDFLNLQKKKNKKIIPCQLPDVNSAMECWFRGNEFYNNRNSRLREIFNHNRLSSGIKIEYTNKFKGLKDGADEDDENIFTDEEEEEEEEANDDQTDQVLENDVEQVIRPHPEITLVSNDKDSDARDIDTEEEEDDGDKLYGDEDILAMTESSFSGSNVGSLIPPAYADEIQKYFEELVNSPSEPENAIYVFLININDPLTRMIKNFEEKLEVEEGHFNNLETRSSGNYLRGMKLIAMTSTVASVRKEALEVAGCEIMLIEEAGELTESMTSCILPKTLKRLILIGDYQQLRPKVEHQLTFKPYHYDISLFEKLVVNAKSQKADCLFTLSVQRRMHPDICNLVRNVFYQNGGGGERIVDDVTTNELGIPYGIPYRVRFFMHDYKQSVSTGRSYENPEEAKFCAALVPFFICRGYKPSDITIISLYKGQRFAIVRELKSLYDTFSLSSSSRLFDSFGGAKPHQIKVVVLDNFQGEENKIIIVSTTRSDKPGFVKNPNRALVTLSRAREMLVVVGNKEIFGVESKDQMWSKISTVAQNLNKFCYSDITSGEGGIAVNSCKHHNPGNATPNYLKDTKDILRYRFSFCKEKCNFELPCGHRCKLTCHCHAFPPTVEEHENYCCPYSCMRTCTNGHQCNSTCGLCTKRGKCPPCRVKIQYTFPDCAHTSDVECHLVTSGKAKCKSICGKRVTTCGHVCQLQCGHKGDCKCKVENKQTCPNCNRDFTYICGEPVQCSYRCNAVLDCGHTCSGMCHLCSERRAHQQCEHDCEYKFPCGHRCSHKCSDPYPEHHHFYCMHKINHSHGKHNRPDGECGEPFILNCSRLCEHTCDVCKLKCQKECSRSCIPRCECRCQLRCHQCGAQCRALSGETCIFFCPHHCKEPEPEPKDKLVYVFHTKPCHYMLIDDAREAIQNQYNAMMRGISDVPEPIHRLTCPYRFRHGGKCTEKIVDSWLFDHEIKEIENTIRTIKQKSKQILARPPVLGEKMQTWKVNWYKCDCGEVFFIKYQNPDNILVTCPRCHRQTGSMFE
ncbi:hypothetical protein TRFO_20550 [Tritrichomonas foetus]|uniref:NFX1-type zinc finger-containing protein 1 n=1 Tax=Tritrichomonas foetus TaxID=1144522 RepID=A0A1J4KK07_9EUKA|nr:hypothetical protein TRFO_20550 [Tritrichomonas foetus]|eukprot:OHT10180.1 hypothetical protein TRFO_20550 [Tritrichomonas foetus]